MGISFGSINTGLPKDIVQQIMKAERIPLANIQKNKEKINAKKTLVKELSNLVSGLSTEISKNVNARSLREIKVSANKDIIETSPDKNIINTGTFQFEVLNLAQKSSAMTSGFSDKDKSNIGVGFIRYFLPNGKSKELYVNSDNSSLTNLARLINKNSEKAGMKATVVNDGTGSKTPWRLVLSLDKTGDNQKAEFPYLYFVDGETDLFIEFERKAKDAKIKLDGFEIEVDQNKTSEIIPGLTIDLKKASPGEEFSIQITEDVQKITDKISSVVEKINSVLGFIKKQNNIDENTDTSRTLGGDIILQTLESRLRNAMFKTVKTQSGNMRAGDIGIEFTRSGLLKFDPNKFESKINTNYKSVSELLTGSLNNNNKREKGLLNYLENFTSGALRGSSSTINSKQRSLDSKISQIDRRIEQRERLLEQKEQTLKEKFSRLEGQISRIKSQGAGVSALGASSSNFVTQL